jgi:hypothetical protein
MINFLLKLCGFNQSQKEQQSKWVLPECTCGKTMMCRNCEVPWIPIRPDGSHKTLWDQIEKAYNTPIDHD